MAKDTDHLADGFETENTGGVFSGLLADEDVLDRRALWRIGSWGVGAVGAVILAVMANQSSLGLKRDQLAAAELTRQAQQIQQAARDSQKETRRLASAIDTLNSDRDRLFTRVTTLEQGLDTVTGAITRQGSAGAVSPASPFSTADIKVGQSPAPAPVTAPVASVPADVPAHEEQAAKTGGAEPGTTTISTVAAHSAKTEAAKTEAAKAEVIKAESAKAVAAKAEIAKAAPAEVDVPKETDLPKIGREKADMAKREAANANPSKKTDVQEPNDPKAPDNAKAPAATPATPLMAAQSLMAPPDPAASKLIAPDEPASAIVAAPIPEVVASTATDEEADDATAPKIALHRTEFGVDLGTAHSVSGLRALWRGLLKSRSNAPLNGLRPIIVIKERHGHGVQLRLVAGPLNDAGAAARICAVLTENKRPCETTVFDGQRLSMKSEDAPPKVTTKQRATRKHGSAKRAATVAAEEPPKKPETPSLSSSIASMFGKKNAQ